MWESYGNGCNCEFRGSGTDRALKPSLLFTRPSSRVFVAGGWGQLFARGWVGRREAAVWEKIRIDGLELNRNKPLHWVMNTITSILGTVSASNPSAYGIRSFCRTQAEPPGRPRVQKTQKDLSDSSSMSISSPVPRTNSRKRMSARLVNKKSSNRVTSSAFVAVSSDAASQFACSDRLILIAARESLLQRDGSSISGGLTSNW